MKNIVKTFSLINTIEGYSYLVLLFVAMPMKYFFNIPLAVKIAGMAHGVLFIMLLTFMLLAYKKTNWPFKENIVFFIGSIVPFGTFYTKNKIAAYA